MWYSPQMSRLTSHKCGWAQIWSFTVTFSHRHRQRFRCSSNAAHKPTHTHTAPPEDIVLITTGDHQANKPTIVSVVFWCTKAHVWRSENWAKLYLREEKSRVLHLSSLNATMERSASAPLRSAAMQALLLFNLHLCLCTSLSLQIKCCSVQSKFLLSSRQHQRHHKHLEADTTQTRLRMLITLNEHCSSTYFTCNSLQLAYKRAWHYHSAFILY